MSDNKPPCECIESVNGRWTYRCECSNGGDAEGAAYWVAYENARIETADTITRLIVERDALSDDRDGYVQLLTDQNNRLTADNKKLRAALLVARKYVLVQSCELSLQPDDAARDLDVIDEALEEGDDQA